MVVVEVLVMKVLGVEVRQGRKGGELAMRWGAQAQGQD